MSTIFGIKTNSGQDAVVLATDTQLTIDYGSSKRKIIEPKMRVEEYYALAYTGTKTKLVERFFSYVNGRTTPKNFIKEALGNKNHPIFLNLPKNPVQAAIEAGYFPELALVNSDRYSDIHDEKGYEEIFEDLIELIIANRNPLGLYRVDSLGRVKSSTQNIEFLAAGSGSGIAQTYIDESEYKEGQIIGVEIRDDKITIPIAVSLSIGAIKKASKDMDTGGSIDLVVLTEDKIYTHGQEIRKFLAEAEREIYQKIIGQYS